MRPTRPMSPSSRSENVSGKSVTASTRTSGGICDNNIPDEFKWPTELPPYCDSLSLIEFMPESFPLHYEGRKLSAKISRDGSQDSPVPFGEARMYSIAESEASIASVENFVRSSSMVSELDEKSKIFRQVDSMGIGTVEPIDSSTTSCSPQQKERLPEGCRQESQILLFDFVSQKSDTMRRYSLTDKDLGPPGLRPLDYFDKTVGQVVISDLSSLSPFTSIEESFTYEPSDDQIVDYETKRRWIFSCTHLNREEITALKNVEHWLNEKHSEELKKIIQKKHWVWLKKMILRVLYSVGFEIPEAAVVLLKYYEFRIGPELPLSDHDPFLKDDLNCGACYWHGRDSCLRPILIIRLEAANHIKNDLLRVTRLFMFCFEYFLRFLTVAGKVENWVTIFDCNGKGPLSVSPSLVTTVMGTLHDRYKGRLFRVYVIDLPRWMGYLTTWIMSIVPANSKHKLKFYASNWKIDLLNDMSPHQLEERYGGTQPNVPALGYYPYRFFSGPFASGERSSGSNYPEGKKNLHFNLTNEILTGTIGPVAKSNSVRKQSSGLS